VSVTSKPPEAGTFSDDSFQASCAGTIRYCLQPPANEIAVTSTQDLQRIASSWYVAVRIENER
jgi:hypothetical protein